MRLRATKTARDPWKSRVKPQTGQERLPTSRCFSQAGRLALSKQDARAGYRPRRDRRTRACSRPRRCLSPSGRPTDADAGDSRRLSGNRRPVRRRDQVVGILDFDDTKSQPRIVEPSRAPDPRLRRRRPPFPEDRLFPKADDFLVGYHEMGQFSEPGSLHRRAAQLVGGALAELTKRC